MPHTRGGKPAGMFGGDGKQAVHLQHDVQAWQESVRGEGQLPQLRGFELPEAVHVDVALCDTAAVVAPHPLSDSLATHLQQKLLAALLFRHRVQERSDGICCRAPVHCASATIRCSEWHYPACQPAGPPVCFEARESLEMMMGIHTTGHHSKCLRLTESSWLISHMCNTQHVGEHCEDMPC